MVRTWREIRDGTDRVYFDADDGARLGYLDLGTGLPGDVHLARTEDFYAALRAWRRRHPTAPPAEPELVQNLAPPPARPPLTPATRPARVTRGPAPTEPALPAQTHRAGPPRPLGPVPTSAQPWVDLATNQPGQGAAAVAAQLRRDHPITTRLGRLLGRRTDERAWRIGAKGEEKTASHLRKLTDGDGWYALHSVPVSDRGTDIDHVLIGPGGIFTINTKHHPGALVSVRDDVITVNRHPTEHAQKARAEADRAGRLLGTAIGRGPIAVTPLVVIVGAGVRGSGQPRGVTVLVAPKLVRWLRKQPLVLNPDTVAKLYNMARRSTTWLPRRGRP